VGILAHELSHIDHGHQLRLVRASALTRRERQSNPMLLMKQFARPYRADDEANADLDAASWINQLGYDPMEMAALFRRLATKYGERRTLPEFLRTHPYFADRYSAVRAFVQQEKSAGRIVGHFVGRENLSNRTARHLDDG
jgi:predicted Zn-dependent protease